MKQTYPANATTNVRLRSEMNKSNLSYRTLSLKYGVSENTIGNTVQNHLPQKPMEW